MEPRSPTARGPEAGPTARAVGAALERELRAGTRRKWAVRLGVVLVLSVGGGVLWSRRGGEGPAPDRYTTARVEPRTLVEEVSSTGKVKPLKEVQVGAQVSGRVVSVGVDFNARVTKGALLAEIDPRMFGAQVTQMRAQIDAAEALREKAKASLALAENALVRARALEQDGLSTRVEVDQAGATRDVARAEVAASEAELAQLRAQLQGASTTLQYTRITSPIDGVVITRAVDPGQTVAASFSSPVLFVIAPDLARMQVLAEVDEADVGKVREGMAAEVVVDAFPDKRFAGKVSQIRYSPNEVQGVVTYSAVVDVANPELELRPGMTATVTIETRRVEGALAVPNAALRFRPVAAPEAGGPPGSAPPPAPLTTTELRPGQGRVYQPHRAGDAELAERVLDLGITDGKYTEIRGGLAAGAEVVTEQRDAKKAAKVFGLF